MRIFCKPALLLSDVLVEVEVVVDGVVAYHTILRTKVSFGVASASG
jgi:hypothetical protein